MFPSTKLGWLDPRSLAAYFKENGIEAWLDIQNLNSTTQLFGEITKGMNMASVIVACVSDEYVQSANCKLEFRFAHISLKVPIIKAVVGTGNEWRKNEVAFLGSAYSEVNFQVESPGAHKILLDLVKNELEKVKEAKSKVPLITNRQEKQIEADTNASAFQEIYELTQRKFLRQLTQFSDKLQSNKPCPRLLCIDMMDQIFKEVESAEVANKSGKLFTVVRLLCEHEEGWHLSDSFIVLPELLSGYYPYLARIINIIKNGNSSSELKLFLSDQGHKLINEIETKSLNEKTSLDESYLLLRSFVMNEIEKGKICSLNNKETILDLERAEMKNGKILWLCKRHIQASDAKVLSDEKNASSNQFDQTNIKMLEDIDTIKIDLI